MRKTLFKKYLGVFKNRIATLGFSICFILVIIICSTLLNDNEIATSSNTITNWGLSFQKEGETPIGNASSDYLKQFDSYFVGDETEKKIYLTFDAGYENGYTNSILDTLKKHEVSATFFLVGNYLETEPDIVQRMLNEGHTVGNHTWSHPDMSKISSDEIFEEELKKIEIKYKEITGKDLIKVYRPPQGKFSEKNLKKAQELGYSTIFWSLAYADWYQDKQASHEEAFAKLIPRIHNGAIVLLHSTSSTNCEILEELIIKWKEAGFEICSLEELIVK